MKGRVRRKAGKGICIFCLLLCAMWGLAGCGKGSGEKEQSYEEIGRASCRERV